MTNLLVVAPLSGEADDGLLVLAREVTGGAGLFVGDKVSLSRRNHDVRERGELGMGTHAPMARFIFPSLPQGTVMAVLTSFPSTVDRRRSRRVGLQLHRSREWRGGDCLRLPTTFTINTGILQDCIRKQLYIVIDQNTRHVSTIALVIRLPRASRPGFFRSIYPRE